jgi:HEAT repeat protein
MKAVILILVVSCSMALAEVTPLAPAVDPLPHEQVAVLFDRINKGEKIDLPTLYQALNGPQTTLRAYAARELGKYGDGSSVPYLIDSLSDDSFHVGARYASRGMETTRYWANESLKALTREDFGFVWDDPIEQRNQAIGRWCEWYRKIGKTKQDG